MNCRANAERSARASDQEATGEAPYLAESRSRLPSAGRSSIAVELVVCLSPRSMSGRCHRPHLVPPARFGLAEPATGRRATARTTCRSPVRTLAERAAAEPPAPVVGCVLERPVDDGTAAMMPLTIISWLKEVTPPRMRLGVCSAMYIGETNETVPKEMPARSGRAQLRCGLREGGGEGANPVDAAGDDLGDVGVRSRRRRTRRGSPLPRRRSAASRRMLVR